MKRVWFCLLAFCVLAAFFARQRPQTQWEVESREGVEELKRNLSLIRSGVPFNSDVSAEVWGAVESRLLMEKREYRVSYDGFSYFVMVK